MQEIHSMGGTRFFGGGGGGGGGDRRLRQHHHQNHQALKCPRCDSLNTKFCYYNNYNLSQPRHFCKSCRRYWTKGGVLRNVPVGGGCRKSKRSKPKNSPTSETSAARTPPPSHPPEQDHNSNSHSSSESSSLTAANTTAATTEALSAPSSNSASNNNNLLDNIHESKFIVHPNSNPSFEQTSLPEQGGDCSGIFSEIGSLTSLITSTTTNDTMGFEFGNMVDASPFRFTTQQGGNDQLSAVQNTHQWQHHKVMSMSDHRDFKLPEITDGSLLDQTAPVDLSALQSKANNGGFGSLDWHGGADQGLFDLPNTVDQAYWSQTQWTTDQDNLNSSLYLP